MSQVDWNQVPQPEPEEEPKPKSSVPGILIFVFFLLLLAVGGGGFLNVTLLGTRFKERAIDECDGPACVIEVRTSHDDCYSAALQLGAPGELSSFTTPPESNELGVASADYAAYRRCVGMEKPKTLQEAEDAAGVSP